MNSLESLDCTQTERLEILESTDGLVPPYAGEDIDVSVALMVDCSDSRFAPTCQEFSFNELAEDDLDAVLEVSMESEKHCPIEGHGGHWEGARGDSAFYPDRKDIPANTLTNPDQHTWGEILDKYGIDKVEFKEGEPDFTAIAQCTVEIDNFTGNRMGKGGNFEQASAKLAEQNGQTKQEIKEWMKENHYTWHERSDCKTMDLVPTEVHGNIRHEGGIAEFGKS